MNRGDLDRELADRCLTVPVVADLLVVGTETVHRLCRSGELGSLMVAGRRLVPRDAYERWLETRGRAAAAAV